MVEHWAWREGSEWRKRQNGSDDRRADKWIRSAGEAQAVSGGDLGGEVRRGCEFQSCGGECAKVAMGKRNATVGLEDQKESVLT